MLPENEFNLIDYWRIIWNRKILILIIFFGCNLFVFICCKLSTKTFESTASIVSIASQPDSNILASIGAASDIAQLAGISSSTSTTDQNRLVGILKSKTMRENIVNQFNLVNYYYRKKLFNLIPLYRILYIEDAMKYLEEHTEITISDEGVISIVIADKNPKMAADIANAHIENLEKLIVQLGTGIAGIQKRFIAEQLEKTEKNLKTAEDLLRHFKEKYNTIDLDEQSKSAIEATAYLKGEIMAAEVQLQVMLNYTKDSHPDIVKLKERINELKRQLSQSQYSSGLEIPSVKREPKRYQKEIYLPIAKVPQVALELARLIRDEKVQEALFVALTQQLEQAKIAEVRNTPVFQILDNPKPPERYSKPKTIIIMIVFSFVGTLCGIFVVLILGYVNKQPPKQKNKPDENK